jgi:N-acetylglucosaminyldiphosphoundecaprenol N-acetyl-beta-D-mannosaminyltransferase
MTARHLKTSVGRSGDSRFRVLGVRVDAVTPQSVIESLESAIAAQAKTYVVFSTVSSILNARDDAGMFAAIEDAGTVTPDGMPLVWLGRRRSRADIDRVYGPDFMTEFIGKDPGSLRHFFYGGAPGVADEMAARLRRRWPKLVVAGTLCPDVPTGTEFLKKDVDIINAATPDVVWVGLGHPKQERWMHTHRDAIDAPVLTGVGAAFDFLSGRKAEAPRWVKRSGLQWVHRLLSEPRRLWRRYLVGNSKFVYLLARENLTSRGVS